MQPTNITTLNDDRINYLDCVDAKAEIKAKYKPLRKTDIELLKPNVWLDDKIINEYIFLLTRHYKDFMTVDTFYATLIKPTHTINIREWRQHRSILFPICSKHHWFLVEFNFTELIVYDSLYSSIDVNKDKIKHIADFICVHFKINVPVKMSTRITKEFRQKNYDDCGVYLLMYANSIVSETCFFKGDMNVYRNRIVHELVTNTVIYSNDIV